ncbi:MAG: SCP2 sterol-binding domain-containing protein [Myxococcota bacterium]
MTPREYFEILKGKLSAETAAEVNAIFLFDLTGDNGGKWWISLLEGKEPSVGEGENAEANVTITMDASDFVDMVKGDLNPQMAFMGGKLKVAGSMGLALKLQKVLL